MLPAHELIVDTDYVAGNKDRAGVVLLDARSAAECRQGMVPGAALIGTRGAAAELRDATARILPVPQLEQILGAAGVRREDEVIVYGGRGDTGPTVVFWLLEHLGVERVRAYMEGIDGWVAAGHALSAEPRRLPATRFSAAPRDELIATTAFVKSQLHNRDVQFLDTRSVRESRGEDVRALRGGHIDALNHINIPFEQAWIDPGATSRPGGNRDGMALKDRGALAAVYGDLDADKEVIAYCQTGTRSTFTYLVLRALGYPRVRNYDDSWIVWGSDPTLPAAK